MVKKTSIKFFSQEVEKLFVHEETEMFQTRRPSTCRKTHKGTASFYCCPLKLNIGGLMKKLIPLQWASIPFHCFTHKQSELPSCFRKSPISKREYKQEKITPEVRGIEIF